MDIETTLSEVQAELDCTAFIFLFSHMKMPLDLLSFPPDFSFLTVFSVGRKRETGAEAVAVSTACPVYTFPHFPLLSHRTVSLTLSFPEQSLPVVLCLTEKRDFKGDKKRESKARESKGEEREMNFSLLFLL